MMTLISGAERRRVRGAGRPARAQAKPQEAASPVRTWRTRYVRALWCGDLAILGLSLAATALLFGLTPDALALAVGVGALWMLLLAALDTRAVRRLGAGSEEYKLVADAALVTAAALAVVGVGWPEVTVRPLLFVALPAGAAATVLFRVLARRRLHSRSRPDAHLSRVVVVGAPADVAYAERQLGRHAAVSYRVVGLVTEDAKGKPEGASAAEVLECVRQAHADAVLVAGPLRSGTAGLREMCWALQARETEVILISSLVHVSTPRLRMRPLEGLPLMHVELPRFQSGHLILKRCADVTGALAVLLVLAPILAVLALLVRRDSPGPALFSQERVGLDYRPFRMLKFRSMVLDAEAQRARLAHLNQSDGVLFKIRADPRVTRVGRWMRRHSLDELPQIVNVLRGEMSLVGPRPPLPEEVQAYRGHAARRLNIKPGLTGLWQVSGRSDLDAEEALRLDIYYVENWSMVGDLIIMWRTLRVMLNGRGGY